MFYEENKSDDAIISALSITALVRPLQPGNAASADKETPASVVFPFLTEDEENET